MGSIPILTAMVGVKVDNINALVITISIIQRFEVGATLMDMSSSLIYCSKNAHEFFRIVSMKKRVDWKRIKVSV